MPAVGYPPSTSSRRKHPTTPALAEPPAAEKKATDGVNWNLNYNERLSQTLDMSYLPTETLAATTVTAEAKSVRLETKANGEVVGKWLAAFEQAGTRHNEEQKPLQIAKLTRLATALNEYHAAHGHYPPSAVIGPDGKTPHS